MIDFYLGKDLNEALSISTRLDVRDAAYTDKNYMQRFHNGYNKLISDDYIKELQGQIQKAKDTREKAKKAYEKEIANKESVAELRNSLNEMLVRQAELHSFLGRASDSEIERLKAIYGDGFEDIVKGKFGKKEVEMKNKQHTIPTKSKVEKDLSTDEIKQIINTWDLNNPKKSDKLIISKVDEAELELLAKDFDFKGNYAVAREIDSEHLAHALNRHGDEIVEKQKGQNAINVDEILTYYPAITKPNNHDLRIVQDNGNIFYAKQINGHFIAIEEVLTGRNKLRFDTAWKQKGKLNEKVLFKNAKVFPNAK